MTQTFPIERTLKTFSQLQTQFNLQRSTDEQFFTEWLNIDTELDVLQILKRLGRMAIAS